MFRSGQARKGRWTAARDGMYGHSTILTVSKAYSFAV